MELVARSPAKGASRISLLPVLLHQPLTLKVLKHSPSFPQISTLTSLFPWRWSASSSSSANYTFGHCCVWWLVVSPFVFSSTYILSPLVYPVKHLFFECKVAISIWSIIHMGSILYPPKSIANIFGNWLNGVEHRFKRLIRVGALAVIWSLNYRQKIQLNKQTYKQIN